MMIRWRPRVSALVAIAVLATLNIGARCRPPVSSCPLSGRWHTVDTVAAAAPAGLVTRGTHVFAAGRIADGSGTSWITRRSLDGGLTWETVDTVPHGEATGITVDPVNGDLYVLGRTAPSGQTWTVRKSSDLGSSWTTIDEVAPTPLGQAWIGTRIAVDGPGAVIAVGYESSDPAHAVLRRSEDGGKTWSNVDFAGEMEYALAVGAGASGEVVVAGIADDASAHPPFRWVVRYSPNGKTGWTTVDRFELDARGESVPFQASIGDNGRILVAGRAITTSAPDHGHLIVRESRTLAPAQWRTLLDFVPSGGGAQGFGVMEEDGGEIFVTGEQTVEGHPSQDITLRGNPPWQSFVVSDAVTESLQFAGETIPPDFFGTASVDHLVSGEVLEGFRFASSGSESNWLIRRLECK